MSPNDPLPIFLTSRYFPPTWNSARDVATLLLPVAIFIADADTGADTNADMDADTAADTDADEVAATDADKDAVTDADKDPDMDPDMDADADAATDADADVDADANGSGYPRRLTVQDVCTLNQSTCLKNVFQTFFS